MRKNTPPPLKDLLSLPHYKRDTDLLRNMVMLFAVACLIAIGLMYMHHEKELKAAYERCMDTPYSRKFQYMNHAEKLYSLCFEINPRTYKHNMEKAQNYATPKVLEYILTKHRTEKVLEGLMTNETAETRINIDSIVVNMETDPAFGAVYGKQALRIQGKTINERNLVTIFQIMDLSVNDESNTDGAIILDFQIVDDSPIVD